MQFTKKNWGRRIVWRLAVVQLIVAMTIIVSILSLSPHVEAMSVSENLDQHGNDCDSSSGFKFAEAGSEDEASIETDRQEDCETIQYEACYYKWVYVASGDGSEWIWICKIFEYEVCKPVGHCHWGEDCV